MTKIESDKFLDNNFPRVSSIGLRRLRMAAGVMRKINEANGLSYLLTEEDKAILRDYAASDIARHRLFRSNDRIAKLFGVNIVEASKN